MIDLPGKDKPQKIAGECAEKYSRKAYQFDFSLISLENGIDAVLENEVGNHGDERAIIEAELTAYFGETLCRIFNTEWAGSYYGPLNRVGANYYTCKITKGEFELYPSHFIGYYLSNGKESEGTFKDYLISNVLTQIT